MSKSAKKAADQAEREKVHKRYSNRREPDVIYPAKKQVDFYDADIHQRVAVYVRVSTDNLGQETSYELQKNYYEEFVLKHPNWKLVKIYADKGISGTSTKHRVELNQMLADSRAGKIDLIITKSVSRLARNTVDCITMVRNLAELRNPVGVFFESECIFSLNEDTNMPLSFLASIAENESRIRSRSMEVSLAQRLNGGLPLTPKLLGYSHDTDGKLVINPDEAPTVKLIFYMYLSGYSSSHIAKTLEALGKRTFLGNSKWTSGTVIQVLRNERHCGDVLTRKTFTPDVISHKSKKNRGERQQSLYKGEHEAIVSRDDYIAVQHMFIAVLGSDRPLAGGTSNRVKLVQTSRHYSVEFYSNTLLCALVNMIGTLDFQYSYRMSGEVDVANRVAYFSMKTLKKNERRPPSDG